MWPMIPWAVWAVLHRPPLSLALLGCARLPFGLDSVAKTGVLASLCE